MCPFSHKMIRYRETEKGMFIFFLSEGEPVVLSTLLKTKLVADL